MFSVKNFLGYLQWLLAIWSAGSSLLSARRNHGSSASLANIQLTPKPSFWPHALPYPAVALSERSCFKWLLLGLEGTPLPSSGGVHSLSLPRVQISTTATSNVDSQDGTTSAHSPTGVGPTEPQSQYLDTPFAVFGHTFYSHLEYFGSLLY